jgi:hypothetical protein
MDPCRRLAALGETACSEVGETVVLPEYATSLQAGVAQCLSCKVLASFDLIERVR